jgi:hypothetical protein
LACSAILDEEIAQGAEVLCTPPQNQNPPANGPRVVRRAVNR